MKSLAYQLLDVFTSQPFGGNQLAVFRDGRGLSTAQMQQLATELNLAETTFVLPGESAQTPRVRIFTPACEVDFAGHPTVGTAIALARNAGCEGTSHWRLEENVGPVPVRVETDGERYSAALSVAQLPQVQPSAFSREDLAAILSLDVTDFEGATWWSSCGLPFEMIELSGRDALARATADASRWQQVIGDDPNASLYLFCREGEQVYARMFGIAVGITEDPATGSAAAALAGVLAQSRLDGEHQVSIAQGIEMGRPSEIQLSFTISAGEVCQVTVAGSAVLMGEGQFYLPHDAYESEIPPQETSGA